MTLTKEKVMELLTLVMANNNSEEIRGLIEKIVEKGVSFRESFLTTVKLEEPKLTATGKAILNELISLFTTAILMGKVSPEGTKYITACAEYIKSMKMQEDGNNLMKHYDKNKEMFPNLHHIITISNKPL